MKKTITIAVFIVVGFGLLTAGCSKKHPAEWESIKNPEVAAQLKSFVAEKTLQAKADGGDSLSEFRKYFAAAQNGDWLSVSNQFEDLKKHAGQYEGSTQIDENLRGSKWTAVIEVWGAFDEIINGGEKYPVSFGKGIIQSIPPGSIYFGGTDPGRFIVTAMEKSQADADPFFTLTQNALADGTYLDYLRSMYGDKIYIPTAEDSQKCFEDYTKDVTQRQKNDQLKPGEDVHVDGSGRVQISGQVAVMEINGLLVKTIFEKNPDHEFYIEESFPLDWMYPNIEPHGLIMKIDRQPLASLSDEIVRNDSDYWTKYAAPMIGGWLGNDTTVEEVAAFADKVYVKKDLSGFTGDPQFVQNEYSCKMFSKLRSSIAGLYAWRAQHSADAGEKNRMNDAADFAFRQAWALCPYSPEAVFRYVNFLLSEGRTADAVLIAETAEKISQIKGQDEERQFSSLAKQLNQYQNKK